MSAPSPFRRFIESRAFLYHENSSNTKTPDPEIRGDIPIGNRGSLAAAGGELRPAPKNLFTIASYHINFQFSSPFRDLSSISPVFALMEMTSAVFLMLHFPADGNESDDSPIHFRRHQPGQSQEPDIPLR